MVMQTGRAEGDARAAAGLGHQDRRTVSNIQLAEHYSRPEADFPVSMSEDGKAAVAWAARQLSYQQDLEDRDTLTDKEEIKLRELRHMEPFYSARMEQVHKYDEVDRGLRDPDGLTMQSVFHHDLPKEGFPPEFVGAFKDLFAPDSGDYPKHKLALEQFDFLSREDKMLFAGLVDRGSDDAPTVNPFYEDWARAECHSRLGEKDLPGNLISLGEDVERTLERIDYYGVSAEEADDLRGLAYYGLSQQRAGIHEALFWDSVSEAMDGRSTYLGETGREAMLAKLSEVEARMSELEAGSMSTEAPAFTEWTVSIGEDGKFVLGYKLSSDSFEKYLEATGVEVQDRLTDAIEGNPHVFEGYIVSWKDENGREIYGIAMHLESDYRAAVQKIVDEQDAHGGTFKTLDYSGRAPIPAEVYEAMRGEDFQVEEFSRERLEWNLQQRDWDQERGENEFENRRREMRKSLLERLKEIMDNPAVTATQFISS